MSDELPSIRFALPPNSENRWSDLLAVLVQTDPTPLCDLIGAGDSASGLSVIRESAVTKKDRPDLLLNAGGRTLAVIEVKVLSGLGYRQLERYEAAEPTAEHYVVVSPSRLAVDTQHAPKWRTLTWEAVIDAYCGSAQPWVRTTAEAWRVHLDAAIPKVDSETVWNDLVHREDFVVAMRARMAWLFSNLRPPIGVQHDLVASSAGVSWVLRMFTDVDDQGYRLMVELEERLGVRDFPKLAGTTRRSPIGPSAMVVLSQTGVTTSAGFDWDRLLSMWPAMESARTDWVRSSPRPKNHDRDNYLATVAKGGPKWLGVGFGEAQTKLTKACMFGARVQFAPDITLGELLVEANGLCELVVNLAHRSGEAVSGT